jgi:alpha-1,6-mannosyltransferase
MSSDATTLRLRGAQRGVSPALTGRKSTVEHADAQARRRARIAAGALVVTVACSLLFVIVAADRPSLFAAPSRAGFFPGWMAGPLGGLWPGLTRNGTALRYMFTGGLAIMYGCYLLALSYVPSMRFGARWVIAALVAVHVIFLLAPPISLTDLFNYINYGRMEVVHHLNPYTSFPVLEPHSDPSYTLSNWHELTSPYGPLFTLFTFALVPLGVAGSFWAIKAVLMVASLGILFLVWRCAQMLDLDPVKAIMLIGLNPIVLVWGLGGDHNDFLTVFAIVLGVYLLLRARAALADRRGSAAATRESAEAGSWRALRIGGWLWPPSAVWIGAGAAFVAATTLKASAGLLLPIVLVALLRRPRSLVQALLGMLAASVVVGLASLIAFGLHLPDLGTQSQVVAPLSIPNLLGLALGAGGETETLHTLLGVALVVTVLWCCAAVWRGRDFVTVAGWATVALLVTLGWVLPWYVMWLLPLAALSPSSRLRQSALVLGVYLIVAWSPASGLLWNAIGFQPQKTSLGQLHQRYVKELLN